MKKSLLLVISLLALSFLPNTYAHDLKGAIASDDGLLRMLLGMFIGTLMKL